MESKTPSSTLRSIGFQTKRLFKDAIKNASALNAKDVELEDPFETQLAAEANRFGLWAMNLGIFAPDHGSLDYRVKDSETIRDMLETFLVSLNTSLYRVLAYYSSFSNDPVQNNGGDESSEEDLSGSESSEDGWNEFDKSISSNLTLLLDGVRGPLDRLYRLSTWIRNPSSRSISSKVQSHQHIDPETEIDFLKEVESFEIDYIRSVFFQYRILKIRADGQSHERLDEGKLTPNTSTASEEIKLDDSELSLIHRLARANVRRRQRFSYWRKHQEKLALYAGFDGPKDLEVQIGNNIEAAATSQNFELKQNDKVAGLAAVPPGFGSVTTATRLNIPQLAVFKDDFSAVSVSKYAPSNWLPDNETLEFPEPPNSQSSDKEFECPYCFTICRKALLKSDAWKAHLIHDLQPYICTYQDCTNSDNLYDDRGEWIQHENLNHRRVFHCAMHPSEVFLSRKDFEDHIQDGHLNPDNENPAALVLQASQSTSIAPDRRCPICLLSVEKLDALTKHIALHLERFSLFSLPRDTYSAEENEKTSELSKKANPNLRGSRHGDFEEDQVLIFGEQKEINDLEEKSAEGEVSNISSESSSQTENCKSEPHTPFKHEDYEVGWICFKPVEYTAALLILDERHPSLPNQHLDKYIKYILGRIGGYNIVVAHLIGDRYGQQDVNRALIKRLHTIFTSIRFSLVVGVGAGMPNGKVDIRLGDFAAAIKFDVRLGDVVVGTNVIQWDSEGDGSIQMIGSTPPPELLRNAAINQQTQTESVDNYDEKISKYISDGLTKYPQLEDIYSRPIPSTDVLYAPDYYHNTGGYTCELCDPTRIITRPQRDNEKTNIHYGFIASSNRMAKHGLERDKISSDLGGIHCLDIGLASLMDGIPFLAIRGICDYSDSHRNKIWERYASITAASVAKDILMMVPEAEIRTTNG
ncbi:hypothetical protein TWF679_005240 [Orbilia oligospora]|uniref:Oxidoreductase acuF-like C2H2 type zinc-finger domain-containing protein n=1 Tax=Orbilia oligospora TaxID=2813651 RepID=A0A8H8VC89_ORBOL|nr:hypothetical protein TWF679_005240 [Orbilia oligospora]